MSAYTCCNLDNPLVASQVWSVAHKFRFDTMNTRSSNRATGFLGWRMVALASLSINIGGGFTFGAYGTFMPSIITEFSASHSLASSGLSLLVAVAGVCAPVVSYAISRWSIRSAMIAGCVLMSAGWALVGIATSAWYFTLGFGILCGGGGACLMGVPPLTLINNWFIALRGRAIGIAMVLILAAAVPSLVAAGITTFGWRTTALTLSAVSLLFTPLMLLVIDHPESVGQTAAGGESVSTSANELKIADRVCRSGYFVDPVFWILLLSSGLCAAGGVALITHLVPFALWRGLELGAAASLASILGGAALFGGLIGGVIADRIGGARTFAIIAFAQFVAWPSLFLSKGYPLSVACVTFIGLCASAMQPAMITLLINIFGRERFAHVMGRLQICATPLNIVLPLLAGVLYDLSGSYRDVFIVYPAMFGIAAVGFCIVSRAEASRQTTTSVRAAALSS